MNTFPYADLYQPALGVIICREWEVIDHTLKLYSQHVAEISIRMYNTCNFGKLCVCVCVCVCVCARAGASVWMFFMHWCLRVCICVCVCVHVRVCTCLHACIHVCVGAGMYTCAYVYLLVESYFHSSKPQEAAFW